MRPPVEPDNSDPEHNRAVDSRAYAFAFLIREPSQVPADFTVDWDLECALFLPRESVPRFEIPHYVPRLLLLWPDRLTVRSHPSCGLADTTICLADISYLELERFMADCSLTFFTPSVAVHLPFNGRDEKFVGTFVSEVQQRLLAISNLPSLRGKPRVFGSELGFKFAQIEATLKVDPEGVLTRFYVPPTEVVKPRLFRQELSWTYGSEIVLTEKELYLFSDDKDGYRQLYGFRASWVPLCNIRDVVFSGTRQSIVIKLRGDLSLKVAVPSDLLAEAKDCVTFLHERICSCHGELVRHWTVLLKVPIEQLPNCRVLLATYVNAQAHLVRR